MAVLKNLVLAATVLAPLVACVPMLDNAKRAIWTNTVTEIEWVTVEETTTVWLDPSSTPAPEAAASVTSSDVAASSVDVTWTPSTFATLAAAPQAPPTSVPTVAPAAAYSAPAEAPSSTILPIPAPTSSSPASASLIAPMVNSQPRGTVGTDGLCSGSGDACQGDVTHWDGGLGACGWNVNTDSDLQIALPFEFMGSLSNGNPYCGRSVTLYNPSTGNTVSASVGDKCM